MAKEDFLRYKKNTLVVDDLILTLVFHLIKSKMELKGLNIASNWKDLYDHYSFQATGQFRGFKSLRWEKFITTEDMISDFSLLLNDIIVDLSNSVEINESVLKSIKWFDQSLYLLGPIKSEEIIKIITTLSIWLNED